MVPSSAWSKKLAQRSSVVLPEPEGPISETTSPLCTVRSTPFSTSSVLNDLRIPVIFSISCMAAPPQEFWLKPLAFSFFSPQRWTCVRMVENIR